ncbi:H-type lectin domain-containing protein [Palleronia pelagia]|uniref:H-type lectin domain-containing protein n=1 Tax=Palleronia pelagia TaxID=387096 RepID=A0A1H8ATT1_9RHOB|nr:H-type lectin domain-containing protein [Palleronia pelagia]SEM73374.1 H-type lectin domain-containing protein [Palleronia pelagia]
MLFSDFAHSGPMWTGEGPREVTQPVVFVEPFLEAPHVMVSVALWDIDSATNMRADISAQRVTPEGFSIVFKTWGDSRLARVRADWTAIGAVDDPELWDVD